MGKFTLIILLVYAGYYLGNIVYDLFVKKHDSPKSEDSEEFSLAEFAEQYREDVKDIRIEDVENLRTPSSFTKKELFAEQDSSQQRYDLGDWRKRFEAEENIDSFESVDILKSKSADNSDKGSYNGSDLGKRFDETPDYEKSSVSSVQSNREKFRNLLNLAETSVQLIAHPDGYKIYQSMM